MTQFRTVERVIIGQPTSDGAGVKLTRVITNDLQRRLDPFLMLDNFGSENPDDYIAGFPNHPHRGFETVTYMIAGRMLHEDSHGNRGLLENGGVQWMTAGRGVFHSEIPQQEEGVMEGFQLWLNLPAKNKMCPAWYKDFTHAELPKFTTTEGVQGVVIAGEAQGVKGAVQRDVTEPLYLDLHFTAGQTFEHALPAQHNVVVFVYRGQLEVGGQVVGEKRMAIMANEGDAVKLVASGDAKALLIAGKPLNEPIAQYGPFVMNTKEEIYQALNDFRDGKLVQPA